MTLRCKPVPASRNRIASAAITWEARAGRRPGCRGWQSRVLPPPRLHFLLAYVRNPKAANPGTQMAGSPDYDDATIAALEGLTSAFLDAG